MVVGYGKQIRLKINEVQASTKKRYKCPSCSRVAVRRKSLGIWRCDKCKKTFASGAYDFLTK